jgi:cell division control protein 45
VPACEAGRIAVDFEYQFMLYRHWSLYDSMLHSPYVASKLLLWWAHGRQRLDELLAKMGFSLNQCKCVKPQLSQPDSQLVGQPCPGPGPPIYPPPHSHFRSRPPPHAHRESFKYMDADLKARLRDELDAHQDEFGLDEVFFLSFHRRMHYGAAVSAADVVHSVAALLEAWQGPPGSAADPAAVLAAARTPEEEAAATERIFTARFHEAYDALSGQDEAKLTEGIRLAMALQKAVFRVAVSLHDKKAVRNLDHFRWTVVHNNLASAEDYLLTQPMAITRLAQLMIDVSREEKARAQQRQGPNARALWRPKPFLVFAERRNTYLGKWDRKLGLGWIDGSIDRSMDGCMHPWMM